LAEIWPNTCVSELRSGPIFKTEEPKTPATGLLDIKKSFEKNAMTFLARTKIKGIY
jgi:hypothetical protein